QLLLVPDGFTINPKLQKQLERRRPALTEGQIEWAHAEALAFASLLAEGTAIRLTGQDTERGTFSQRHLVLHDARDGRRHAPIERFLALGADGNIRIANCTTPAQYFHLLRRQARHAELRPLVLFTPKSLLRLPQASSRLEDLTAGRFSPVLDDATAADRRDA